MPRKRSQTLKNEPDALVSIFKLACEMGISEAAIRGKISCGYWVENLHYYRRGRRVMMDPEACKKWYMDNQ